MKHPIIKGLNIEYTYNQKFNQQLHNLHKMSNAIQRDSLVASQSDNSKTAADLLTYKIAEVCNILDEPDQKKKVIEVVRSALENFGQDEDSINNILKQFSPNMSIAEYRSTFVNSHLIQASGLVDALVFESFRNDALLPINRNKKFHCMDISPRYIVLILKKCLSMYDDTVRVRYMDNVRIFAEKVDRALVLPFDQNLFKTIGHDGLRTIRSIQRTCSFLASEILESEKKQKLMALEDYSRRPVFKSFKISTKNLTKVSKTLESSTEAVDLVKNSESFDLTFNCFKCISAIPNHKAAGSEHNPIRPDSPTGDLDLRPPLRFIDTTKSAFNVYKGLPITSRREAEEHLASVHSVINPRRLAGTPSTCGGHTCLIFCDLCTASCAKIVFSATCCLTHRYTCFSKQSSLSL